jgi:hypothetical protein|tara:strand:- start:618 stop:737 length:120 start_codon:yes stop_codon:yes gene_type:complete
VTGVLAGLTAWAIEVGIALLFLYAVKREENKVIERRKNK